jgi:ketosteroid isomerase-like protein
VGDLPPVRSTDVDQSALTTTSQSLTAMSIQVLRIRDGQIMLLHDFADPRGFEELSAVVGSES